MKKLLWVLNVLLVGLLGYLVAGLAARPATPTLGVDGATPPQRRPELFGSGGRVSAADVASITRRNVFGVKPEAPSSAQAQGKPISALETKGAPLRLRLVGTIAGPPDFARAVIEDLNSKTQEMYKIGGLVQGAAVELIERNRVVLVVGGRKEVLEVSLAADVAGPPVAGPAQEDAKAALVQLGQAVRPAGAGKFDIDRSKAAGWGGMATTLMKTVKLEPHMVDGKPEGLELKNLPDVGLASLVGLKDGDIIQTVNGQKMTGHGKAFQVWKKARGKSSINMEILRGGEKRALTFELGEPGS